MADPKFCNVKKAVRESRELLREFARPRMSHGKRERIVDITKYGSLLLPLIGMQSDRILHEQEVNHVKNR